MKKYATGLKTTLLKANHNGVIIGLSGGIDSAVVAALCVKALGKENVIGVALPCESNPDDARDAELVAKFLGIDFTIVGLSSMLKTLTQSLPDNTVYPKLVISNTKARLRMTTLYAIGGALNLLVVGTCNKSEIAVGYFTKHGDGGSDFEPIGEFYKYEVYEIARELSIPEKIINRTPTAGLFEGQTDETEMGITYKDLDIILKSMLDGDEMPEDMDREKIKRVAQLSNQSEHKRTTPPVYQRDSQNFE